MSPKKPVYVVSWSTESSDHGLYVFEEKPSEEYLDTFMRKMHPDEFWEPDEDNPNGASFMYWNVSTQAVRSLKPPGPNRRTRRAQKI